MLARILVTLNFLPLTMLPWTLVALNLHLPNGKKGLQTLDKLIGIQTADVENETTPDVQSYLKQAIEHGGHNRALVFRFQHHEDKFKKIQVQHVTWEK